MKNDRSKHIGSTKTHTKIIESVAAMASGMTDHFNNILTTVMGACTLIDKDDVANKELLLYVSLIRVSAERAAALSAKLMIATSLVQNVSCSKTNMKISKSKATSVCDK